MARQYIATPAKSLSGGTKKRAEMLCKTNLKCKRRHKFSKSRHQILVPNDQSTWLCISVVEEAVLWCIHVVQHVMMKCKPFITSLGLLEQSWDSCEKQSKDLEIKLQELKEKVKDPLPVEHEELYKAKEHIKVLNSHSVFKLFTRSDPSEISSLTCTAGTWISSLYVLIAVNQQSPKKITRVVVVVFVFYSLLLLPISDCVS